MTTEKEFGIFCPHCHQSIWMIIELVDYGLKFEIKKGTAKAVPKVKKK